MLVGAFYPEIGGGPFEQWSFAKKAAARGHDVKVFTPRESGEKKYENVDGVEIRRPFRSTPSQFEQSSLVSLITRVSFSLILTAHILIYYNISKFDIIYSSSHNTHFVGRVVSGVYRIPYVNYIGYTTSVNPSQKRRTNILYLLEQINFRLFMGDSVFCRTPEIKRDVQELSSASVEIIHGVLDAESISQIRHENINEIMNSFDCASDDRILMFVARLTSLKQPCLAVRLMDDLPSEAILVIVGDGPLRKELEDTVDEYGLSERVILTGELPHKEALRHIAAADDLIVTSKVETYPTVVFEALSLTTNVFAPSVGILPHISHPRLKLCRPEEIPDNLPNMPPPSDFRIDEEVLDRYSIDHYIDRMLNEFSRLT